jgi:molybdenum cofactor cytidylyltransferase
MPSEVAAVVLAAGTASRYRAADPSAPSKLVAELDGKPLVRHVAEAALGSRGRPVIVVTGHAREAVAAGLAGLPVQMAFNPEFAAGLAGSLATGLAAVPPTASAAIVLLGDMPRVTPALVDRLIDAFERAPQASAVVPLLRGARGNPVVLSRRLFADVRSLSGDEGARRLLARDPDVLEVNVEDDAIALDIDTPQALRAAVKASPG